MASRSDSGNETRGSSESDNSPTPTKELQNRSRFTPTKQSSITIVAPSPRGQINTRTTPVSRTTPTTRPYPQPNIKATPHRLTPTTQRVPVRPLQRRPPSTGMGSAGSVHAVTPLGSLGPLGPLGPLTSARGRQRNSVAIVDSRDHIYEELEICRGGPPKIAPVSGVLQQGKVVIRPIAFKPILNPGGPGGAPFGPQIERSPSANSTGVGNSTNGSAYPAIPGRPDPRYTSTPTLIRGPIQHYGSMGDLKSLGHNSSYSLDRRGVGIGIPVNSRAYYDPYLENNNNNTVSSNNKINSYTKLYNTKNNQMNKSNTHIINLSTTPHSNSSNITSPASSKGSPTGTFNCSSGGVSNNNNRSGNSSNSNHSPPSYPLPPPRPPSHQSTCSNIEDGQSNLHHHRYASFDNRLSNTYDPMPSYDHTTSNTTANTTNSYPRTTPVYESSSLKYQAGGSISSELPRFESLRNLSSNDPHGGFTSTGSHLNHTRHHHHRMGGSVSNLTRLHHSGSISGSNLGLDRSFSATGSNLVLDRSVSGSNMGLERAISINGSLCELRLDDHHQTPSPSDSGVAELEQMLKEKDSEINTLKETMEQNEQVIFKVYEEKEKTWERELKKIRDMYDSRLKAAQQKALKVEQSLSTQNYQLQQDKRKLSAEFEEVKRERDSGGKQVEQLRKEITSLRSQLEDTEWGLCQKSGEISLLKTQLKDSQGDQTTRGHELLHLRAQVRQYQQEVERRRAEITSLHDLSAQLRRETTDLRSQVDQTQHSQSQDQGKSQQMEKTRLEVDTLKRERDSQRKKFEEERAQWVEEKNRVIRYQKQLHHNYVSILTRNRQLEEEVAKLAGVPLPPSTSVGVVAVSTIPSSSSFHSTNSLPVYTSSNGPSSSTYTDIRESGPISISSESRC